MQRSTRLRELNRRPRESWRDKNYRMKRLVPPSIEIHNSVVVYNGRGVIVAFASTIESYPTHTHTQTIVLGPLILLAEFQLYTIMYIKTHFV